MLFLERDRVMLGVLAECIPPENIAQIKIRKLFGRLLTTLSESYHRGEPCYLILAL